MCLVGHVNQLFDNTDGDDSDEKGWNVMRKSRRMAELEDKIVDQDCLIEQYKAALGDRENEIDNLKLVSISFNKY